ncbi:uncharacterized protein LOC142476710, partial [Ascaphus truei]|uniref:uncharacterized protein LOC142476710 n=1 Tax=Ascaphus truei TaxID=8439 RepID=UPI003F592C99
KWKPFSERDSSSLNSKYKKKQSFVHKTKQKLPPSQHFSGRRKNRKCGACEACLQKVDCGECDFCQDKPKFGGRNLKRQKCRWRQCLRFAMEKNIPAFHKSSKHPMLLERIKREAAGEPDADSEDMEAQQQDPNTEPLSPLRVPVIKLERMEQRNGHYLSADELHHSHVRDIMAASRAIKQEMGEASSTCEESEPLNLHRSVKTEEFIIESDDIAEADESTPVIMEIFSLGSFQATSSLDSLLQEFMSELNEIPLPAHWEVQAHRGPNLQLVQRSRLSTMADTVIHIQPGLHFHVVVRGQLVPSFHELYTNHPSRLTTVDDVVELICDLEAYQLCDGHPQNALRSPECRVLVYEERCAQCCTIPWPSGSDL